MAGAAATAKRGFELVMVGAKRSCSREALACGRGESKNTGGGACAIHRSRDKSARNVDGTPWCTVGSLSNRLPTQKIFAATRLPNRRNMGELRGVPRMSEGSAIDAASKRLALALDALAAAVERRREADRGEATLDAQLHALGADRSRLASELDAAAARARTLENANREVAQRLDAAIDTIRSVLAASER
jgi:hypothetical protein